eukprot:gene31130-38468_t
MPSHLANECLQVIVTCPYFVLNCCDCSGNVKRGELASHLVKLRQNEDIAVRLLNKALSMHLKLNAVVSNSSSAISSAVLPTPVIVGTKRKKPPETTATVLIKQEKEFPKTAANVTIGFRDELSVQAAKRRADLNKTEVGYVGSGVTGTSGDGGPATSAQLKLPYSLFLDSTNVLYLSLYSGRK